MATGRMPNGFVVGSELNINTAGNVRKQIQHLNTIVIGVVVVLVAGFIALIFTWGGMLNDSLAEKKAISLDMRDKLKDQNDKLEQQSELIEALTKEIQGLKNK